MDYLFLDRHLVPADPSLIREQPLISPGTTVCFSQIDEVPITPDIPELVRGHLTVGTLNNSYKLTRSTIARWARVLQALPTAQFLFVRREFQSYWLRDNVLNEFSRNGIARERIHFFNNRLAGRHYLDCYNEIDFTLDTFPVTGGTTTTDALWMGVPVVALQGENVHQRVCSAILHHAGHPEWIATNDDQFMQIALDLAADQPRRIQLRQALREELAR
jgi:predicted O-linked N-acetylglucosamine transferase (SPINDLY family)